MDDLDKLFRELDTLRSRVVAAENECVNLRSRLAEESLDSKYIGRIHRLVRANQDALRSVNQLSRQINDLHSQLVTAQGLTAAYMNEVQALRKRLDGRGGREGVSTFDGMMGRDG